MGFTENLGLKTSTGSIQSQKFSKHDKKQYEEHMGVTTKRFISVLIHGKRV